MTTMKPHLLLFWRQEPSVRLLPQSIAQEVQWGEEVKGLEDLPVKEILAKIKEALPGCVERAGHINGNTPTGTWELTWGWQYLKLETPADAVPVQHKVTEVLSEFGIPAYDPQQGLRHKQP